MTSKKKTYFSGKEKDTNTSWLIKVHRDLKKVWIGEEDIGNREVFRKKIAVVTDLSQRKQRMRKKPDNATAGKGNNFSSEGNCVIAALGWLKRSN